MRALDKFELDLKYSSARQLAADRFMVPGILTEEQIRQVEAAGYIVTFKNVADRDYYVGRPFHTPYDPNHDAFKTFVGPLLDKNGAFVFDFNDLA